jgi:hypothetical protein
LVFPCEPSCPLWLMLFFAVVTSDLAVAGLIEDD